MTDDETKIDCNDCGWAGRNKDLLTAPNPFDSVGTITGCPRCKSIDCFALCCDEPKCWNHVSCGFPTPDGYRRTCSDHYRVAKDKT